MTIAKSPTSTETATIATADAVNEHRIALESKLSNLASYATHGALRLWHQYRPVTNDKTQAVWQLLRTTQPVHLLLAAALAVLAIALITLVTVFNGLIILLLKIAALGLAAVAVGQWVVRGFDWADGQLPSTLDGQE